MIPNTLQDVIVGDTISPEANFIVPIGLDVSGTTVTFELQDGDGATYASGNATGVQANPLNSTKQNVVATASLTIPENLPATQYGSKYQILWVMESNGQPVSTYIETFAIRSATQHPFGVPDIVVAATDTVDLTSVLLAQGNAALQLYLQNTQLLNETSIASAGTTYEGLLYKYTITSMKSLGINPSLEPYNVLWEYTDSQTGESVNEDGGLYLVTPSIVSAAKELLALVNRANNQARLPDTQIDMNVAITFLKLGADYFNATGMPTYFNMTNAQGPIRSFWITCSEILLLQSQYLVEAERSMTMSGQSVQLDLDITSYYENIASQRQSYVDTYVPDLKKNLTRRGITSGTGDYAFTRSLNVGGLGVALTPVSNYYGLYSKRYPRYRG